MPPHHGYADDWYWEDLPASAQKAASLMGYDQASWDAAEKVAYHSKDFTDLSADEKRAAVYLGRNPLDYKLKSVKWATINDTMKKYATIMGWTEETWNRNFPLHDVPVDQKYWKEMSAEEKEAAEYFGYNENLWNETGAEEVFDGSAPSAPAAKPNKPSPSKPSGKPSSSGAAEEKKDDDASDEDSGDDDEAKKQKKKKRAKFSQSPAFGGEGGENFDHGNHMHIDEITVAADGNHVHGIAMTYRGQEKKSGSIGRDNTQTFKLRPGEFITSAKVTVGGGGLGVLRKPQVTSITFFTNRGAKLGPCGNEKGDAQVVKAPPGTVLCGIHGRAGRHINAVGFKWGPNAKA